MEEHDLYATELQKFQQLLAEKPNEAYRRYGLCLFYGLPDDVLVRERARLQFPPRDALDHYNQGALESAAGNHREALAHYRKAMSAGADLPELYYNLALTYRELGETREAKKNFQRYLAIIQEWEDEWNQEELETAEEVRAYLESS
ncbi:tetratricopeptide repeat protein [bacterium]|nr:tetratricopeptide repeat protein [bacterium]